MNATSPPILTDPNPASPPSRSAPPSAAPSWRQTAAWGTACCIYSAMAYTVVNSLLRLLSVQCDKPWILFIKETVTVLVLLPWVVLQWRRGWPQFPDRRGVLILAMTGIGTQLIGNLSVIWALSVIGLSITVPLNIGVNLVTGAMLSWIVLGERVSLRAAMVVVALIVSIVLLSVGADRANQSIAAETDVATGTLWVALAVAATCVAGVAYAVLGVAIRQTAGSQTHPFAIVFIITVMGTLMLGPVCCWRGFDLLARFTPLQATLVVVVGLVNLTAFLAVTRGLQLTPVVRANILTASQVAMGAVVGMLVFAEPPSPWLVVGVSLTIAGVLSLGRGSRASETVETPV